MEEFDEKLGQMTNEMIKYIKKDNLSMEILKFLDNNFECEKIIKGPSLLGPFYYFLKRTKSLSISFIDGEKLIVIPRQDMLIDPRKV